MCKVLRPADMRGVFGIRHLRNAVCAFLRNETGLIVQTLYQKQPYTLVAAQYRSHKGAGVANKIPRDKWDPDSGVDLATTRAVRDIADQIIAKQVLDPNHWDGFVHYHLGDTPMATALIAWRDMAAAIQAHNEACNETPERKERKWKTS